MSSRRAAPRDIVRPTEGNGQRMPRARRPSAVRDAIVAVTAPLVGDEFLLELVRQLHRALDACCVFIAEDADAAGDWRTVVIADDDSARYADAEPFAMRGGATEPAAAGQRVAIAGGARAMHPGDAFLQARKAESYLALPLMSGGSAIGVLGVAGTTRVRTQARTEQLIEGFRPRAAIILERRRMERRLRQEDLQFRLLADHADDVIFRMRLLPERRFEYVSPAVYRATGYTPQDFYDNVDLGIGVVHEDDRARATAGVRGPKPNRFTARWRQPDGQLFWAEYSVVPVLDAEGRVEVVEGIIRDVTERVALESALNDSEQRQRAVIAALPDMVFRIDGDGVYREYIAADGMEPYLPAEEFIGRAMHQILPEDVAARCMATIRRALTTRQTERLEYDLAIDDEMQHFEARIVPAGADDVLAFVRDFTAERRMAAEEARRADRDRLEQDVERTMSERNPYGLTFREFTVLHHVGSGAADKQIAEALGISTFTVSKHVASILMKMGVPSRAAAGVKAVREGLIA